MNKKIFYLIITLFLFSCSSSNDVVSNKRIQKRKYTKGYCVKKYGKTKHKNNDFEMDFAQLFKRQIKISNEKNTFPLHDLVSSKDFEFSQINKLENLIQTYIPNEKIEISNREIKKAAKNFSKFVSKNKLTIGDLLTECDELIMTDGSELTVKILEITPYDIKYKNCDNISGPTFTKPLSSVFKIKYANGTSQVMNSPQQNSTNNNSSSNDNSITNSLGLEPGEKSQSVAIGLWFFLGILGIHRFYLGHIGMGILYLLTGSLCGIGWLIDGILFLTGALKPADGKDYGERII